MEALSTKLLKATLSFPFLQQLAHEPYEPRGIMNSEMALILGVAHALGIDLFLESGRARGQSTYLLGKYLPSVDIHSFEFKRDEDAAFCERRVKHLKNVSLHYGNGAVAIPEIVRHARGKRKIAVLLDGPKGEKAVDVLSRCPGIKVGFIHDMRGLDHGEPSSSRAAAVERFPKAFFSDDQDFVEATAYLDGPVAEAGEKTGWKPYYIRKTHSDGAYEYTGSYGPTVGAFLFNGESGSATPLGPGGEVPVFQGT